jgi:integrase/recombinase XerD
MERVETNYQKFRLEKARRRIDEEQDEIVLLVYEDDEVLIDISEFVEIKSINSINTGKSYANAIVLFLNYLDSIGKTYLTINKKDIMAYYHYLAYGKVRNVRNMKLVIRKSTLMHYISALGVLYDWLKEKYDYKNFASPIPSSSRSKEISKKNKYSFLYGQIWNAEKESTKEYFPILKDLPKREHIKWYKQNEIDILTKSFKKRRDRVIFLISVRLGCRISEILSIREEDYDSVKQSIYIRESKTKSRYLFVPRELCDEIDTYMYTERASVEKDIGLLDYLFVNLKKDKSYGQQLTPRNYLSVLKGYAGKVGFNPKKVITHAGRSTRAQELIEQQIFDLEVQISDAMIMEIMGWSRIESIKPYKQQNNLKIQEHISNKTVARRRGN